MELRINAEGRPRNSEVIGRVLREFPQQWEVELHRELGCGMLECKHATEGKSTMICMAIPWDWLTNAKQEAEVEVATRTFAQSLAEAKD